MPIAERPPQRPRGDDRPQEPDHVIGALIDVGAYARVDPVGTTVAAAVTAIAALYPGRARTDKTCIDKWGGVRSIVEPHCDRATAVIWIDDFEIPQSTKRWATRSAAMRATRFRAAAIARPGLSGRQRARARGAGVLGVNIPTEYGGVGASALGIALVMENMTLAAPRRPPRSAPISSRPTPS